MQSPYFAVLEKFGLSPQNRTIHIQFSNSALNHQVFLQCLNGKHAINQQVCRWLSGQTVKKVLSSVMDGCCGIDAGIVLYCSRDCICSIWRRKASTS